LELFLDLSTNGNHASSVNVPFGGSYFVPAAAATNPFSSDVSVSFPVGNLAPGFNSNFITRSATLGGIFKLARGWGAELDYTWSKSSFNSTSNAASNPRVGNDIASGILNPFVDTLKYPLNLAPYLLSEHYYFPATLNDFALRGSGPLFRLPVVGSVATLTVGLEHRREGNASSNFYVDDPVDPVNGTYYLHYNAQSETIDSIYSELNVPLLAAKNHVWGANALELQIAGRVERYGVVSNSALGVVFPNNPSLTALYAQFFPILQSKTTYRSTNPTIGLKYQPVAELTLRGSYATAFLPPTFSQLLRNPISSTSMINDPKTGTTYGISTLGGGNPNLTPQSSTSWDVGIIWEPQ